MMAGGSAEARLIAHCHYGRSLRARVLAETNGCGGSAMNKAAHQELADILQALVAHYVEADRQSRDGILWPRAGGGRWESAGRNGSLSLLQAHELEPVRIQSGGG